MVKSGNAPPRRLILPKHKIGARPTVAIPIVEQKVRAFLKMANRASVFRNGRVSFIGSALELHDEAKPREVYL